MQAAQHPNSGERQDLGPKAASILDAASRIFLDAGYEAASMDAIAREAGASKATVYAYFPGKESLFAAMVRAECRRSFDALAAEVEHDAMPDVLLAYARRHLALVLSAKGLAAFRIVAAESVRFPELGKAFWEAGPEESHRRLAAHLAEFVRRGELALDDPRAAAAQLLALARSDWQIRAVLCAAEPPGEAAVEKQARAAVDAFLRAFAPAA